MKYLLIVLFLAGCSSGPVKCKEPYYKDKSYCLDKPKTGWRE